FTIPPGAMPFRGQFPAKTASDAVHPPQQSLKIPQPDRGGNGEGFTMVIQSLLLHHARNQQLTGFDTVNCAESSLHAHPALASRSVWEGGGVGVVGCSCAGGQRTTAMFEMLTAAMGLVGAGIFLAHAFEGVLSRA